MDALHLLFFATLMVHMAIATHSEDQLYFTNLRDIQLFVDNNTRKVIANLEHAEALDCNICDRQIYWVDNAGKIKRGIPGNDSSVQVIVEDDLVEPYGLAVDWKGNNVYFSQRRGSGSRHTGQGRIEVVKCDGKYRKVLRHQLQYPGPIALDIQRGYLYYTDLIDIWQAESDGRNARQFLTDFGANLDTGIIGLALDTEANILYWTTGLTSVRNDQLSMIKWINLTDWIPESSPEWTLNSNPDFHTIDNTMGSSPHGIFFLHNVLYWTEIRLLSANFTVLREGALYALNLESNITRRLVSNSTISPQDLSSFSDMPEGSTGCADANGGCSHFCFTVPDGQSGTTSRCGCPTGTRPHTNNNTCPDLPSNFLLFLQNATIADQVRTEIRIVSLDIESTFIDVLVPINIPALAAYIAYDTVNHMVYWTQTNPPAIMRARLGGTEVEPFITTSIRSPEGIAVEPYTRILFWVDSVLDHIEVVSLQNNQHRKVLIDGLDHPQGIAINVARSKIYWTDLDAADARVERAFMDGMIIKPPLQTTMEVKIPTDIAVDPLTHQVFWADIESSRDHIIRYDESTVSYQELNIRGLAEVRGLAVFGDVLYWSDLESSDSIAGANKESGNDRFVLFTNYDGVMGLLAVNGSEEAVETGCHFDTCRELCLLTESNFTCACREFFQLQSDGMSCADIPPLVFIATEVALIPYDLNNDRLVSLGSEQWQLRALAIAVDIRENMTYWISAEDNLIYRQSVSADFTQPVQETVISCCVETPEDLAVDWLGRNLYWTDSTRGTIEVVKLNGRGRTVLAEDLDRPAHIALDPLRGDLYWAPKSKVEIYRMKMNGQGSSSELFWQDDVDDGGSIFGMVLNYQNEPDVLYWGINYDTAVPRMMQFELGSSSDPALFATIDTATPLHLQTFEEGTVYYHSAAVFGGGTVRNIIKQQTAHEGNQALLDGVLGNFTDFVIAHHSLQPGVHECGVNNGGCVGTETLCLVRNQYEGSCECPPWKIKNVVVTEQGETHENCVSTDSFVLIATSSDVHYLPVPPPSAVSRGTPRPLPVGPFEDIRAISYDPINDSVLWLDRAEVLRSVTVTASSFWDILPMSEFNPSSLAYDAEGGHIFATEVAGFQIELLTVNGDGVGSLLDDIQSPSDVVFDGETRTLYWVDHGRTINSLSLNDLSQETLPLTGPRQIQQLSFAAKSLFWINNNTRTLDITIGKFNTTSRVTETLETLAGNVVTFLTAVPVDDQVYVFWYNTSDRSIYFHNGSTSAVYVQWTAPEDIVAFAGFVNTSTTFSTLPCLETPRPCSHICLRQTGGSVDCACPVYRTLQDEATCSDIHCGELFVPCRDRFSECISSYYICDDISHCSDGSDEEHCICNDDQFVCGSNTSICFPRANQCDGSIDCPNGEDEVSGLCCSEDQFGCYGSDGIYRCLDMKSNMCDGFVDCRSHEDEDNCPVTPTTPTTTVPPSSGSVGENLITYITIGSVCAIAVLIVVIFCLCLAIRTIRKHKRDYTLGASRINSHNHSASAKFSNSPQPSAPRSDSMSVFSEMSMGTHSTNLGPYGSNLSPSADGTCKRFSAGALSTDPSNPPPSPITNQPSFIMTELGDAFSAMYSEDNYPIAPNPSLNYDEMSSASLSVSQRQIPAALNGGIHHDPRMQPMYGGRGGGVVMRRGNPLHAMNHHHHNHERYYHPGAHSHHSHNAHPHPSQPHNHTMQHYHQNHHHHLHQNHHFPFQAHDQLETESTLSMTTAHTDNQYDDVTPPGRPPSLATEVSEHYHHIPTSPASLASEDYEEEFLHQT